MSKYKTIIFLLLITTNHCLSQKKANDDKRKFKNAIEISIDSTSSKTNPLIDKTKILLKEGKPSEELVIMYNESKLSFKIYKELVGNLTEADNEINLKAQTLVYLDNGENLLDKFILPTIRYLNESEPIDVEKIKQAFTLMQDCVNQMAILNDSMDKFCAKYKLSRRLNDFDKEGNAKIIDEIETKIGN